MNKFTLAVLTALCTITSAEAANEAFNRAAKAYSSGNYAAAKAEFLQLERTMPSNYLIHYYLGNIYMQSHDTAMARQEYQLTLDNHPSADVRQSCEKMTGYLTTAKASGTGSTASASPVPPQKSASAAKDGKDAGAAGATKGSKDKKTGDADEEKPVGPKLSEAGEKARAKLMADAQKQAEAARAEAKQKIEEASQNGNMRLIQADGSIKYGISPDEEAAIRKEGEAKAAKYIDEAKRQAALLK